jgi:hypothetical protein
MPLPSWLDGCPVAVTVCDHDGTVLDMNDRATLTFAADGGRNLIGKNLMDCHSEKSRNQIRDLLSGGRTNAYTIEKNGVKKLIYQCPWFKGDECAGLVEFSLEIPFDMPHFVRDPSPSV